MIRVLFISLSLFLFVIATKAQQNPDAQLSSNSNNPPKWDTTYYKKYNERFIVSVFQSERRYNIIFDPRNPLDSGKASLNYIADANTVSGIEIDFDKISISFATRSVPPSGVSIKGKTYYTNFGLSFGGNKWFVENTYRRYRGFYDNNIGKYDTSYKAGMPFYQNPSMVNENIKSKFFYFTNHRKFAYKSSYTCVYRQIKTASSWVLSGNIYHNHLYTDTSFAPKLIRHFYGSDAYLNNMKMFGLSGGGGFSTNIVLWRALFFNATGLMNIESQWRTNSWLEGRRNKVQYITSSFDLRFALGINNKNFFSTLSFINDINLYNSGQLDINSRFFSGNFSIGYRFKVKPPSWYKKIQASKIYNMF
ncbi:MAG: DUF4421 family protein [Bacteroidia bacterium]